MAFGELWGEFWPSVNFWGHIVAAFANTLLAIWLFHRSRIGISRQYYLVAALVVSAIWSLATATQGMGSLVSMFTEGMRNFAFLMFMYSVLRGNDVQRVPSTIPAIYTALALVLALQMAIDFAAITWSGNAKVLELMFFSDLVMRMIFAVGALVLVHNLYTFATSSARWGIRMPMTALAAIWAYDLNLYTVAYLSSALSLELKSVQALVSMGAAVLFAIAAQRNANWKVQLSRSAAFQSLSLVAIGGYLVFMVLVAQALRISGSDFARLAQISFVFGMTVVALVVLPSGKFRAWLKVKVSKHFFQHRYDYRLEWTRFADTIGRAGSDAAPFHERVIKAVADITDSPAGMLLTPNDSGRLELQARWNWRTAEVPAIAASAKTVRYFEESGRIVELDAMRNGNAAEAELVAVPAWMVAEGGAWAVVPLVHFERLAGLVILARPFASRVLDWEDFDMLRVAGRQVASYLAERKSESALSEARRFDEFNRRFAFVMHDIKNLVSQLSLVARNAEKHAENPEFRADMVDTLQASVHKMNMMIARLSQYGGKSTESLEPIQLEPLVKAIVAEKATLHDVRSFELADLVAIADQHSLEQVLGHLIQNAIDASNDNQTILVKLYQDGLHACVEVQDSGTGMSAEFVRGDLFKPFVTSKPGGFGIGAYEARELVRAMQGRLEVESREGIGSRFTVRLPLNALEIERAAPKEKLAR